jgi:uncharacterized membrane protein YbaN (DUF454 family)
MNKWLWRLLGIIFVGLAYVGAIVPGVPMTTFVVLAAWAFAKSSPKLNHWLHTHPTFSPHLIRWEEKRIYPTKVKWIMLTSCIVSFIIILLTLSHKPFAIIGIGCFMAFSVIWAWRFPGSEKEWENRVKNGEKIGWNK